MTRPVCPRCNRGLPPQWPADKISQIIGTDIHASDALPSKHDHEECHRILRGVHALEIERDRLARDLEAAEKRVSELEAALQSIAATRYGIESSDSDEQQIAYWSGLVVEYRMAAKRALAHAPDGASASTATAHVEERLGPCGSCECTTREAYGCGCLCHGGMCAGDDSLDTRKETK